MMHRCIELGSEQTGNDAGVRECRKIPREGIHQGVWEKGRRSGRMRAEAKALKAGAGCHRQIVYIYSTTCAQLALLVPN